MYGKMMRTTENLQFGDWHEYAVTSRREILALLLNICNQRSRILVQVGGQPVTWVTAAGCDAATLILERALSREQNDSILKAGVVTFETSLDNIRIVFESTRIRAVDHQGAPAFALDLPDRLIRLQRREFYRVATPVIYPVLVSIPVPKAADGEPITFSLADISCGGICLLDNQLTLGANVGRIYARCKIELPDVGVVTTGLQVRNAATTTLLNNRTNSRLGCRFVDMSSAHSAMVQRYVTKRECERIRASGE
jgi:c-di-GMP-binding flagellar brake protein YcgR